jgi:hypothetical protein
MGTGQNQAFGFIFSNIHERPAADVIELREPIEHSTRRGGWFGMQIRSCRRD